jgi:hypothetical protein
MKILADASWLVKSKKGIYLRNGSEILRAVDDRNANGGMHGLDIYLFCSSHRY